MHAIRLTLALILAAAVTAPAQTTPTLYVHSGAAIAMGPADFSDYYGTGFNFGAAADFDLTDVVAIQPAFTYANFRIDEDAILSDAGLSGTGLSINGGAASGLLLAGNVKAKIPVENSTASPYFLAGIGYYRVSVTDVTVSGPGGSMTVDAGDPESAFGMNFGAGLNVRMAPSIGLFGELTYVIGFTEDENTSTMPIKVGASFRPGAR